MDLCPLTGLTELRQLHLDSATVVDLTPLADLTDLRDLRLDNATDIRPVARLTNLRRLEIWFTPAAQDLTPLARLRNLETLYLALTGHLSLEEDPGRQAETANNEEAMSCA